MNLEYLCIGCLENKGDVEVCPLCGWLEGAPFQSHLHMLPRTVLKDKYLLGRVLGQGGFGITYLALDLFLERKLAIKEYFPRELVYRESGAPLVSIYSGTQTEQYSYGLSKFLDEAKNLARFEGHPNIVSVRDYFEENSTAYMVMNFLDGVTMGDYLDSIDRPMEYHETLAIIFPVLDALRTVHEAGLMHRDISPDNIMITTKKRVMLLDFGAARHAVGEKGKRFSVIVKPGYAPEEQYRTNGVQGPWTDIYAVAATFYRSVTGVMPPESLDRLNEDKILPPSALGIQVPPVVEAAMMKALSVDATNRYQTVAQFQDAMRGQLDQILTEQREDKLSPESAVVCDNIIYDTPEPIKNEPLDLQKPEDEVETVFNIGRSKDNDIIIEDQMVSRYHARMILRSGKYFIVDLNSTHGTKLNGKKINAESEIPNDSAIEISRVRLYFINDLILSKEGRVIFNMASSLSNMNLDKSAGVRSRLSFNKFLNRLRKE